MIITSYFNVLHILSDQQPMNPPIKHCLTSRGCCQAKPVLDLPDHALQSGQPGAARPAIAKRQLPC